jgi:tol-pal system protein YbgF
MDALETAQRTLTGEIETLRYERDNLRGEVEGLIREIQTKQAVYDRMKIHLDAVDLVSTETRNGPVGGANPYAPRVYSGAGTVVQGMDTETYSSQPYVVDPNQPSQVPSAPIFKEQTIGVQEQYTQGNDVSELSKVGQTKLAEGDFSGAQTAFKQYLQFNPDAGDAGEVNFWLGESYYVRGGFADAADAYITSMRKDPKGVKAPDAMVRLAAALRELGNKAEACQTLATFPAQFPNASSSAKEKARVEAARTGC